MALIIYYVWNTQRGSRQIRLQRRDPGPREIGRDSAPFDRTFSVVRGQGRPLTLVESEIAVD